MNEVFDRTMTDNVVKQLEITALENASIGQVLLVAKTLEERTGIPFIRMDQGMPGIAPCELGIKAEQEALQSGCAQWYPAAEGIPQLKKALERFIKAFLNIDIPGSCCTPVTGAVCGSYSSFLICNQLDPQKDTVLFLDPGFPIQKAQLDIMGVKHKQFDIYHYRGAALGEKLEEYFSRGDISCLIYANPNNPAWTCLTEKELQKVGELATKYGVIIIEDLAYFGMDFRKDISTPYQAPFQPTVARYTDNYIILLSSSKIFSYAGQRIGAVCVSEKIYRNHYPALAARYHGTGEFGNTFVNSILYLITSGCTHSTQYAYAAMLEASIDGRFNFVDVTREYERRAHRMKQLFCNNGFHVVYDRDVDQEVGDGFFFTIGYGNMTSAQLMKELLYYGISAITLSSTGSYQHGIRACCSRMQEDLYPVMEERLRHFHQDHQAAYQNKIKEHAA